MARSRYGPNEKRPSVTTILGAVLAKPGLVHWAANEERSLLLTAATELYTELTSTPMDPMTAEQYIGALEMRAGQQRAHRKRLAEAANIGTQVHKRIEYELRTELGLPTRERPELSTPQARRSFERWTEWRKSVQLRPVEMERKVASDKHGYVGTLDLLAYLEDKLDIVDFKTGKKIYRESWLQNAAYRIALAEQGVLTDGGTIVRLPKTADDPEFDAQRIPESFERLSVCFLSLLPLYYFIEEENAEWRARKKAAA